MKKNAAWSQKAFTMNRGRDSVEHSGADPGFDQGGGPRS